MLPCRDEGFGFEVLASLPHALTPAYGTLLVVDSEDEFHKEIFAKLASLLLSSWAWVSWRTCQGQRAGKVLGSLVIVLWWRTLQHSV